MKTKEYLIKRLNELNERYEKLTTENNEIIRRNTRKGIRGAPHLYFNDNYEDYKRFYEIHSNLFNIYININQIKQALFNHKYI